MSSVVAATVLAVSLIPAHAGLSFADKLQTVDLHIKACQQASAEKILAGYPRPSTRQEQNAQELRRIDLMLDERVRLPEAIAALEALLADSAGNEFFRQQVAVLLFNTYFEAGRYADVLRMAQGAAAVYPVEIAALGETGQREKAARRAHDYLARASEFGSADEAALVKALAQLAASKATKPGAYAALVAAQNPLAASRIARKPIALVAPMPAYPRKAAARKIQGHVDVEITVSSDGNVLQARALNSSQNSIFDQAAIDAARRSEFVPGYANCRPATTTGVRRYNFTVGEQSALQGLDARRASGAGRRNATAVTP